MPIQANVTTPHFGELEPGRISLGAPAVDEVLQVNLRQAEAEQADVRRVEIEVEEGRICLRREDGQSIQARVHNRNAGPFERDEVSGEVLRTPVEKIIFHRTGSRHRWSVEGEGLVINDLGDFEMFVDTVADYALMKQTQRRKAQRSGGTQTSIVE
ncbi:MAG TPA: hypothetical protein VFX86_04765 [Candidatus Saccharimonadales bacterium]|nr:hypothetical protein [Candidatus Saccharimonadales bacterium]